MSELKPKRDDEMAADEVERDAKANMPRPSKETKPQGDKLRNAFKNGQSQTKH
jgi:hypothetical protein